MTDCRFIPTNECEANSVLIEVVYKVIAGVSPIAETMVIVGLLVLFGNGVCFLLLYRHRTADLIVGGAIALLFLRTAWSVLDESVREYRILKFGLIFHR